MVISISDLTKVVRNEPFDINWKKVLTVKDDDNVNQINNELMNYFSSNDDDAKIFLIVNNEELGYVYSRDYLLKLGKLLDKETRSIGGDIGLPGESNITIAGDFATLIGKPNIRFGSVNMVNYICPITGCDYKIQRLNLQNPRYMCKKHKDQKLIKEKI